MENDDYNIVLLSERLDKIKDRLLNREFDPERVKDMYHFLQRYTGEDEYVENLDREVLMMLMRGWLLTKAAKGDFGKN